MIFKQCSCREVVGDELKTLQEAEDPRLFSLPGIDVKVQYHIDSCTLAPFNYQAYIASKAIGWDNHHDAAIVWWYFESALWCWNTPASYFEEMQVNGSNLTEEDFYRLCEKDTWNEIDSAKNSELPRSPVVFTNQLFKQGLKTLAHEITVYFSRFSTEEAVQKSI